MRSSLTVEGAQSWGRTFSPSSSLETLSDTFALYTHHVHSKWIRRSSIKTSRSCEVWEAFLFQVNFTKIEIMFLNQLFQNNPQAYSDTHVDHLDNFQLLQPLYNITDGVWRIWVKTKNVFVFMLKLVNQVWNALHAPWSWHDSLWTLLHNDHRCI